MNTIKVTNISELKNRKGSTDTTVELLGYYNPGDEGGGSFYWDNTSTEANNDGTIIQVTSVITGRWKRIIEGSINVKWFGTIETGLVDDTVNIQKAIDFASTSLINTVIFNNQTYLINGELNPCPSGNGGIRLKNNVCLLFQNTTLQIKNSTTGIYSALNFYDSSNNILTGILKIIGDNLAIAEYGHGIYLSKCNNIVVDTNLSISACSGDGIYCGELNAGNINFIPSNIKINNFNISDSGRNGISITGGTNLTFENGEIIGSNLFNPKASIDIELNENLKIDGVFFKNIKTSGSLGTELLITSLAVSPNTKNVNFENCTFTATSITKAINLRYSEKVSFEKCKINGYIVCSCDTVFNNCNFNLTSNNGTNDYWLYSNISSKIYFNQSLIFIKDNRVLFDNVGGSIFFTNSIINLDRTNSTLLPDSTNIFGDATSNQIFISTNSNWNLLFTPVTNFGYSGSDFNGANKKFINSYVSPFLINDTHVKYQLNQIYPVLSTIPSSGNYQTGAIINFRNPSVGGNIGAVCVSGGNPGTWTEFGTIEKLKKGTSIQSGNGVLTSFTIPHTLGTTPTFINIQAGSFDAQDIGYITANSTNITINYNVAPLTGTNNLTFYWEASI